MATTSTAMSSWNRASTIAVISVGAVVTGVLGYAIYFDHRRRTDPVFRKALKRESRKQEKVAKQEADAATSRQRQVIREAVEKANQEGFPSPADSEEVESYFMKEVAEGEMLCQDPSKMIDAALCFFRALKVYPQQEDLITIYDKAVPKPVLDILAEMIAIDPNITIRSRTFHPRSEGSDVDA